MQSEGGHFHRERNGFRRRVRLPVSSEVFSSNPELEAGIRVGAGSTVSRLSECAQVAKLARSRARALVNPGGPQD